LFNSHKLIIHNRWGFWGDYLNKNLLIVLILITVFASNVFAVAPAVTNFFINDNDDDTNSLDVTLSFEVTNEPAEMCFTETQSVCEPFEPFAEAPYAFELIGSDGEKIVYGYFKNDVGDAPETSDNITLDSTDPTSACPEDGAITQTDPFDFSITCEDLTSDCYGIHYKIDGATDFTLSTTCPINSHVTVDGEHTITFFAEDNAGNLEAEKSATIIIDNALPEVSIIQDGITQNTQTISFKLEDALSGIDFDSLIVNPSAAFDITPNPCEAIDEKNYSCSYIEISLVEGPNSIEITVGDKAGNQKVQTATVTYDITTPEMPAGQTCTSGSSNVPISWTANNTDADIDKYFVYRGTTQEFTVNEDSKIKTFNHTDCSETLGTCSTNDEDNLSNGQTYYYKISAVDAVGNKSDPSVSTGGCIPTITTSLATPTIFSDTHPENNWQNNDDPEFKWTSSGSGVIYYYLINESSGTTVTESNKTGTIDSLSITRSSVANGTHYFHVRAKKGDVWSPSTDHYTIKIDAAIPNTPDDFSLSVQSDGDIRVNWDKPSDPGGSGINRYYIVRGFEGNSLDKDDYDERFSINDEDQENYTDESVFSGSNYCYRMYSVDYAENESDLTSKQCKKSSDNGDIDIQIDLPNYVKPERTQINISSTGGEMVDCWLWLKKDGQTSFKRLSGTDFSDRTSSTQYYTFDEDDQGTMKFKVVCENDDDAETATTRVETGEPSVKWLKPSNNETLKGEVNLEVEATHTGYGIDKVEFTMDGATKTATSPFTGNNYRVVWDTPLKSGEFTLKAKAIDKAGNTTEAKITVNLEGGKAKGQVEAEAAIAKAEAAKARVEALKAKFSAENLSLPPLAEALRKPAEAKLELASNYFGRDNFANAEAKALEAEQKFNELLNRFSAPEAIIEKNFSFADEELDGLVKGLLSSEELASQATANLTGAESHRTLKVFKVKDGEAFVYLIAIEVTVTNKTTGNTLKVIEVIPKELALTSDLIVSALPIEVIEIDPIIGFDLNVAPGEKATISYTVNKALTKEEFDSMNSDGVFSTCNKPPLYFAKETIVGKESFSENAVQAPIAFAGLGEFLPLVGGLIVVVVIAFIAFNVLKSREPKDPESFSPLESAASKHGGLGFGSFKRQPSKEPKPPKWGYKGE